MRTIILVVLLGMLACKGSQRAVEPAPTTTEQRPIWVTSRPQSSAYYIGVGLASKTRPDFQESAKKNALNDLASEISVTVEGNSLLYTLDQRTRFDESFTSTIRTRTNEQLEGFEVMDTWENATEYWTYYRLSKSEHTRLKAERKARAIGNAVDLHARAQSSITSGDLRAAFDQDLRALLAMRDYWGEVDIVNINGRDVPLVNELYSDLQRLTGGVQFAILPERCELAYAERFRRELLISATYRNGGGTRDLIQLPVVITWPGSAGKVTELKSTDGSGHVRTTVQRIDLEATAREVVVRLDMDALVNKELDQALVRPVVASLTVPEKRAPIDLRMPRVFMRVRETNLGQPAGEMGLAPVVREELTKRGFRFVERESESELLLDLVCTTRQGGEAQGFFTAFLDLSLTFSDRRSGDVVHEGGRQGVKGVQLDYAKAGVEAYKRAGQDVRREVIPALMNTLF